MTLKKKPSVSLVEICRRNPNLKNRSLLLAQQIDYLKTHPLNAEFQKTLSLLKTQILEAGKLDRRGKRARVIEALKNYFCELDEIIEETKIDRKSVKRVLAVLIRAKLVRVEFRPYHTQTDGRHGADVHFWHELDI